MFLSKTKPDQQISASAYGSSSFHSKFVNKVVVNLRDTPLDDAFAWPQ
jgi:hypothetical protein